MTSTQALRLALPGVRVEHLAWAALIAAAAAIRLTRLDAAPLTLQESRHAFVTWQYSQGVVPEGWPGDLASATTALLFRTFGAGETLLRLVPAVLGVLLIAALWLLRPHLGSAATLLAAAFLTFSPVMVSFSRVGISFGLGPLLAVVMVGAVFAYMRQPESRFLMFIVAALALALSADAIALATALILGAFFAVRWAWERDDLASRAVRWATQDRWLLATAVLYLAVGAVLAMGRWGAGMDRLSTPALDAWANLFRSAGDGRPWHAADVLLAYELPMLLIGVGGYISVLQRWLGYGKSPASLFQQFLVVWATGGFLLVLVSSREEALVLLLLPMALLACVWLSEALPASPVQGALQGWPIAALTIPLAGYAAMIGLRWAANNHIGDNTERVTLLLAVAAIVAVIVLALPWRRTVFVPWVLALFLVIAAIFQAHTLTAVLSRGSSEFLMGARTTAQAPALAEMLQQVTLNTGGLAVVDPDLWGPLAWHVRGNSNVVFTRQFSSPVAVVREAGGQPLEGYSVQGPQWRLVETWRPSSLDPLGLWRWFTLRTPYGRPAMPAMELLIRGS